MSGYFGAQMPVPVPQLDDTAFWRSCNERVLRFQACADCARLRHPPIPMCPHCRSVRVTWRPAPEQARVFSFTVIHHGVHTALAGRLPYVVVVLEFDGMEGVRLVSNLTDVDPREIRIGQMVALYWDEIAERRYLPRFRPTSCALQAGSTVPAHVPKPTR